MIMDYMQTRQILVIFVIQLLSLMYLKAFVTSYTYYVAFCKLLVFVGEIVGIKAIELICYIVANCKH